MDGFNLYHGVHQLAGRRHLWLDLERLSRNLLPDDHQLSAVKYFTAPVRGTSRSRHRQDRYLQALDVHCAALKITTGRFQKQTRRCWSCGTQWTTYEEKESDVNLAIALVEDAALDRFDTALVISGDSDLVPAVRAAKRLRPETEVVAVFPPGRA
ncbi:MAG: NYN domain-containing protein, partial [Natronosporangium sp.]